MIDKLTGLMWPKNGNLVGDNIKWQAALTYANGFNYCGHSDWRLPNINEIESLVNASKPDFAAWLNTKGFNSVLQSYWSSSTNANDTNCAWRFIDAGNVDCNDKDNWNGVWPVRAGKNGAVHLPKTGQTTCYDEAGSTIDCADTGQDGEFQRGVAWPSPRFTANGDCVTDNLTGLMWTKDANLFGAQLWQPALDSANSMKLCGYADWRLPNRKELFSLVDHQKHSPALPDAHPFTSVQASYANDYYWSSSTDVGYGIYPYRTDTAWGVSMQDGSLNGLIKDRCFWVWPVRGGRR